MARFSGKIGFIKPVETDLGIWEQQAEERMYFGDITRIYNRYETSDGVNDNMVLNNTISIVADPYANENFQHMKYVYYMGAKWKVSNAEVKYPRIILNLGGVYNG